MSVSLTVEQLLFIVAFRFEEEWMRDKWIEIMAELAAWDEENEPGTLTYAGGIASADLGRHAPRHVPCFMLDCWTPVH